MFTFIAYLLAFSVMYLVASIVFAVWLMGQRRNPFIKYGPEDQE